MNSLSKIANKLRIDILKMTNKAGSGHPGGSLSAVDFITACLFNEFREGDKFVLSKGHSAPAFYAAIAKLNLIDDSELLNLRQEGSILQGHPNTNCPLVEIPTGSLGLGFAGAVGIALALKMNQSTNRCFVVVGDGECQEGIIWEAANSANKFNLNNLIAFIDVNNLQLDGAVNDIMPNGDLADKFKAFGWNTYTIDGNDINQILETFKAIKNSTSTKPHCIIGNTIKGKGVSFMENQVKWHGVAPNEEELKLAMEELK